MPFLSFTYPIYACSFFAITFVFCKFATLYSALEQEQSPLTEFGGSQEEDSDCRVFELDEIATATNNFCTSNEIGSGGFGRVYKVNFFDESHIS